MMIDGWTADNLISREYLKKFAIPCDIHNGALTDLCVPLYQIDNAPSVEPEITEKQAILLLINNGWLVNHDKELREKWARPHGKWIESDIPESILSKCSVCGFNLGAYTHNFCPNCGAKMDGGEEE